MSDPAFKYTDATRSVVSRTWPDGRLESCLVVAEVFQRWLSAGGQPLPPDPVDPAVVAEQQRVASFEAAIATDVNLQQFKTMDKAAFDAWWAANVTNATQAIAVLKKLTWLLIRYVLR